MKTRSLAFVAPLCLMLSSCAGSNYIGLQPTIEEPPLPSSLVRADDPTVTTQLVKGIGKLEQTYRWTAKSFSILLGVPPHAHRTGANLTLHFYLPAISIERLKEIEVTARLGTHQFASQAYTTIGQHSYSCEIPAAMCTGDQVKLQFNMNKSIPPGANDQRELGLAFTSAQLEPR